MLATMHPHEAADSDSFFSQSGDRDGEYHLGFGEDSRPEATIGPDWESIEKGVFGRRQDCDAAPNDETGKRKRIEGEIRALKTTLEWVIQNGMNEENGVMFRILIAGWIYLEWMREMTLTELATMYGKDKQSFGRWVDDFKLRFPEVRTHNMKIE
jgi:hypothetical protein